MYEAIVINSLFGEYKTPVSSTKSMTGHECWMAGAKRNYLFYFNDAKLIYCKILILKRQIKTLKTEYYSSKRLLKHGCFSIKFIRFGGTNSANRQEKIK